MRTRRIERKSEDSPEPISVVADPWSSTSTVDERWEVTYEIDAGEIELWEIGDD